jgi:fatty-acyl-CoA synthase
VLAALLQHVDAHGGDLSSVRGGICGGSAVPRALMEGFERHGVRILQAWGMTETSPILTVARPPAGADEGEEHWAYRTTQGRIVPWSELRLSEGVGEIEARGPWVAARYYEDPSGDDKFTDDGWLRTGDIGELDRQGYVRITDRAKDLIKSGGEWISSVELETLLIDHPAVLEAAVIAMPDERWGERPLACVALAEGSGASPGELRAHLATGLARWQLPDAFAFIDEVPKTSVGKFDKKVLRGRLADGELEIERAEHDAVK